MEGNVVVLANRRMSSQQRIDFIQNHTQEVTPGAQRIALVNNLHVLAPNRRFFSSEKNIPNALKLAVTIYMQRCGIEVNDVNFRATLGDICHEALNIQQQNGNDADNVASITRIIRIVNNPAIQIQLEESSLFGNRYQEAPFLANPKTNSLSVHMAKEHKKIEIDKHISALQVIKSNLGCDFVTDESAEPDNIIFAKIESKEIIDNAIRKLENAKASITHDNDDFRFARKNDWKVIISSDGKTLNIKSFFDETIKELKIRSPQSPSLNNKHTKIAIKRGTYQALFNELNEKKISSKSTILPGGNTLTVTHELPKQVPINPSYTRKILKILPGNISDLPINLLISTIKIDGQNGTVSESTKIRGGCIHSELAAKTYVKELEKLANFKNAEGEHIVIDTRLTNNFGGERKMAENHRRLLQQAIEQHNAEVEQTGEGKRLKLYNLNISQEPFSNTQLNKTQLTELLTEIEQSTDHVTLMQSSAKYRSSFRMLEEAHSESHYSGLKGYLLLNKLDTVTSALGVGCSYGCKSGKDRTGNLEVVETVQNAVESRLTDAEWNNMTLDRYLRLATTGINRDTARIAISGTNMTPKNTMANTGHPGNKNMRGFGIQIFFVKIFNGSSLIMASVRGRSDKAAS